MPTTKTNPVAAAAERLTYEEAEALLRELALRPAAERSPRDEAGKQAVAAAMPPVGSVEPPVDVARAARPFAAPRWSEKTFWGLLDAAPDGIVVINRAGDIVLVNAQTEKMFGYRRGELLGQPIEVLVPERFRGQHVQHRERFFLQPHARPMGIGLELYGRHKSGAEFPVEVSLSVLESEEGVLVTSAIRNVSERRQKDALLRKAEARYRTLVEEIPAVTFLAALDEGINELYVSPQIEELLGFSQKEWLEDPVLWHKQLHPEDRERWHLEFAQTCSTAKPFRAVYRFIARDGRIVWVHGEAKVFRDEDGRPLFLQGVAFDITAMKRAEEQLLALNQTLEERVAQRTAEAEERALELSRSNAALEDFAGVAAHELKEPLRAMKSFTQLLARRYKGQLDEQADEFFTRVVNAANRMDGLIHALLDYARVGRHGKVSAVEGPGLVAEVSHLLEAALEESGAAVVCEGFEGLRVFAVEAELILLLRNLVSNALKFRGDRPVEVHVHAQPKDDGWLFCVRDNGIGIAPEDLAKLFRMGPEGRLHNRTRYPGHGIGLATCRKIVERHGGRIWVESTPGAGSTFFFTLPDQETGER